LFLFLFLFIPHILSVTDGVKWDNLGVDNPDDPMMAS